MLLPNSCLDITGILKCAIDLRLLKIYTIFVFSIRIMLKTGYNKITPNFDELRFVILPSLEEVLNYSSSIPVNIGKTNSIF
jgi:hypothetical protein